jgi:glycosyltransferase involved in cell wall biosynthesis
MVRQLGEGGCERDAAKLAIGLDRSRFEPHVAVFHSGGFRSAEVEAAGVPILALPVRSFLDASAWNGARQLGSYVRRHGIRLVHTLDIPLNIFAAPVARAYGLPVVITSQLSYRNMYPRLHRAVLRVTDRLSNRVVVNSRAVGETLKRDFGLPDEKLFLCYNGVNPSEFFPGPGIRPPTIQDASIVVGSVCVMRPEKRVHWILQAFARVHAQHPGARFLLVGSGPETAGLKAMCQKFGLSDVCHFEPGQANVADWMRGIDVFITASESESFPNALLEAMACGCCVIGSSIGGIPELITDGEDGLVFDTNSLDDLVEKLESVVADAALRNQLREQAVVTAHERFSMRHTLERVESLYQTLLEQQGCRRLERSAAVC